MKAIQVRAYRTDQEFGNDHWRGEEYSCGRGTHDAVLIVLQPGESVTGLIERLYNMLLIQEAQSYDEKVAL